MRNSLSVAAVCIILCVSCANENIAPFDTPDTGLLALEWGMDPETALIHMTSMEGVRVVRDSAYTIAGGSWATYHSEDSIDVLIDPVPPYEWRYIVLEGGGFLGVPGVRWMLAFRDGTKLIDVSVNLPEDDANRERMARIRHQFDRTYRAPLPAYLSVPSGPGGTASRYSSVGIGGSSDTTISADTYAYLLDPVIGKGGSVRYADRAYEDSVRAWNLTRKTRRMHIKEYEKLEEGWRR